MKKNILLFAVLALFGLISCNTEPEEIVSQADFTNSLAGEIYTGSVNDQFLMVQFADVLKNDSLTGVCFVKSGRALVAEQSFSLKKQNNRHAIVVCDDFKQRVSYSGVITRDTIRLSFEVPRKILGFLPWGKKHSHVLLTPYNPYKYNYVQGRYRKDVFSDFDVVRDVKYGEAEGYWTSFSAGEMNYWEILSHGAKEAFRSKKLPLTMDVYTPKKDGIAKRPLLMLIHGGGFYVGDKGESTYLALAHYFVRKGYVVASINYRMGFRFSSKSVERAGFMAVQDARAALRYMAHHAKDYGIDTDRVLLAGSSAGAITALNVAFMDNDQRPDAADGGLIRNDLGHIDSCGNDFHDTYKVIAIVNMWGAVDDLDIIEDDEQVALLHFHGDSDRIVPYTCGTPFQNVGGRINEWLMPQMCGSKSIDEEVHQKHWISKLITFHGYDHMPHMNPDKSFNANFDTIREDARVFFCDVLTPDGLKIDGPRKVTSRTREAVYKVSPGEMNSGVNWAVEGGFILSQDPRKGTAEVVWYENVVDHALYATAVLTSGLEVKLQMPVVVK